MNKARFVEQYKNCLPTMTKREACTVALIFACNSDREYWTLLAKCSDRWNNIDRMNGVYAPDIVRDKPKKKNRRKA